MKKPLNVLMNKKSHKFFASALVAGMAVQTFVPAVQASAEVIKSYEEKEYVIMYKNEAGKDLIEDRAVDVSDDIDEVNVMVVNMKEKDANALDRNRHIMHVEEDIEFTIAGGEFTVLSKAEIEAKGKGLLQDEEEAWWNIQMVGGTKALKEGYSGKGVKVAVLDTGIQPHADLKVAGGESFIPEEPTFIDYNGHGTHVAGIISAEMNNGGIVGVAPNSDVYGVKVMGADGKGTLSSIVNGIAWSINNDMDIINMSLGADTHVDLLHEVIQIAHEEGILLVGASGNEGNEEGTGETMNYPALYDEVIAISAVDENQKRAWFSSTGVKNEFSAPGQDIVSTYLDGYYAFASGTSQATPHIAGVLAILKEKYPNATNVEIRQMLHNYVTDLGEEGHDAWYGHGLIQYDRDYPPHDKQVKLIKDLIKTAKRSWTQDNYYAVLDAMEDLRDGEDKDLLLAELNEVVRLMNEKAIKAVERYEESTFTMFYKDARKYVDAMLESELKDELNGRIKQVIVELENFVEKRIERLEKNPTKSAYNLAKSYADRLPDESERKDELFARLEAGRLLIK